MGSPPTRHEITPEPDRDTIEKLVLYAGRMNVETRLIPESQHDEFEKLVDSWLSKIDETYEPDCTPSGQN
jgi:hypothetical protein